MSVCEVCGKSTDTPNSRTVYTARELRQTKQKSGYKSYTVTTQYGDFKEHTYSICKSCHQRRTCLVPLVAFFISTPILAILFGIGHAGNFGLALLILGGALFLGVAVAGMVMVVLDIDRKLIKNAIANRSFSNPGEKYKGYTAQQYEALKKPWELGKR